MIDRLPCPIPGCNHSHTGPNRHFPSKSTLLCYLNHDDHKTTFHLADQSICTIVDIYSCTQHSCPASPKCFFRSLNKLTQHNALHHPPPPIHSPLTTDHPPPTPTNTLEIGTSIFYLHRQQKWVSQPVASWHPFHPTTHRSPPTRLPKHMALTPQTPQPFKLSPPTSSYHSSHHRRICKFPYAHNFIMRNVSPHMRIFLPCSLYAFGDSPYVYGDRFVTCQ